MAGKQRYFACAVCAAVVPRRNNIQKYCDECNSHPRSWRRAYMGWGRKPPDEWVPHIACVICDDVVPRRTGSQKYCDDCRQIATSRKVAEYYRRHRKELLRKKKKWRAANRDAINAKQRQYHIDTKAERPTRAMLREMAEMS